MNNKVLLLGNGINRLSNEYSWSDLLDELIKETGTSEVITYREEKPFTLLYEEIYLRTLKHLRSKELRLKEEIRTFDKANTIYSWVDLFLMNDVHILGLALDYTEIDLWWLMIFKERLKKESGFQYGDTMYYQFYHSLDKKEEAKHNRIVWC